MFYFVVRHLRWLARVPGFPQFFDAVLLMGTAAFNRDRLAGMERLEAGALQLTGVRSKVHRFGGIEFVDKNGRELGHLHGNGLLDVSIGRLAAESLIKSGKALPHHIFPRSKWVSLQIESEADASFGLALILKANESDGIQ